MGAVAHLDDLLAQHLALVPTDNAFQRRARLLQALWREERDEGTFVRWTLEALVEAIAAEGGGTWVDLVRRRYLAFERITEGA